MSKKNSIAFLLIHGFTGTHYEMEPLAKHLRGKGIYVENIILPGHETSIEDLANKKWSDLTSYAQEQLDILKKNYDKVYVCGLSLGGAITLYLGADNHDIAGIIPLAAPVLSPDWRMGLLSFFKFIHIFYPIHKNEEKGWEDMKSLETHKSYGGYPLKFISQLSKLIKINRKRLSEIQVPILIVSSKNDPAIKLRHAEKIYNSVSSRDKEIVQINRGGHVIPKDAGRKQLFEEIDNWLEKRKEEM